MFSNCELAFTRAAEELGVAALLEPEDVARYEPHDHLYCTVLYCTVLYCKLYCTVLYCTAVL